MKLSGIKIRLSFMRLIFSLSIGTFFYSLIKSISLITVDNLFTGYLSFMILTIIHIFVYFLVCVLPYSMSKNYGPNSGFRALLYYRKKYKFIEHSKLGYFILFIDNEKDLASLYSVSFFKLKQLFTLEISECDDITKFIKNKLDSIYNRTDIDDKESLIIVSNDVNDKIEEYSIH